MIIEKCINRKNKIINYMRKFQQLLKDQPNNQYGLQFKPYRSLRNARRTAQITDQNRANQLSQTVQIYIREDNRKAIKIDITKQIKLDNLKQIIQKRFSIHPRNQIIYLNGKDITNYYTVKIVDKEILHITNKNNIVSQTQTLQIKLKIFDQIEKNSVLKQISSNFKAEQKLEKLNDVIQQVFKQNKITNKNLSATFLQSGRILNKTSTFWENKLKNNCQIICLLSQNQVEVKFQNEVNNTNQQESYNYKRVQKNPIHFLQYGSPRSKQSDQSQNLKQNQQNQKQTSWSRPTANTGSFLVKKSNSFNKNFQPKGRKFSDPIFQKLKRKSESDAYDYNLSGSVFKKKKNCLDEDNMDQQHLIKKIVVHKSREELQKLLSENSLIKQDNEEGQQDKKSIVSQSSEQQKKYVPIRQNKQYKPCPLIPQKKLPQSQKMKINMQLLQLFGIQPKRVSSPTSSNSQSQNKSTSQSKPEKEINNQQTTRSRVLIRNANLRGSITPKQSRVKILQKKKPSRYAQQNIYSDQ